LAKPTSAEGLEGRELWKDRTRTIKHERNEKPIYLLVGGGGKGFEFGCKWDELGALACGFGRGAFAMGEGIPVLPNK